jgi:tetratricopeptide (TPR) repeat protein
MLLAVFIESAEQAETTAMPEMRRSNNGECIDWPLHSSRSQQTMRARHNEGFRITHESNNKCRFSASTHAPGAGRHGFSQGMVQSLLFGGVGSFHRPLGVFFGAWMNRGSAVENAHEVRMSQDLDRLKRLAEMLQQDASNASLRQHFFDQAMQAGRSELIVEIADSLLESLPSDPWLLFQKANGLIGQRRYGDALTVIEQVRSLGVSDAGIDSNVGLCHFCLHEFDRALAPLQRCYVAGLRDAGVLRLLVVTLHHLSMMDEATKIANENEATAKADAALAGAFALLYLDSNDVAGATRWAKVAMDLNPQSVDGRITQATLLTARLETARARAILEDLINDAPQLGRAWIGLGTLDLLAQDLNSAKQRLARGLELMPSHVGSWHVLGWAQLLSGDLAAADATFQRAMEIDRNFAETHGALASIAAMRGENVTARHLVEVALRLDPQCLSARFAESVLSRNAGSPDQAQKILAATVAEIAGRDGSALSKLLAKSSKH